MKTAKEIYKTIPFNEDYEISNFGNVRSTKKYGVNKTRILKPSISNKGYYMVALSKNGKMHTYTIHNLVVNTFIGERKGLVINHIDGNKLNNHLENLECITQKENMKKAWDMGLCEKVRRVAKDGIIKASNKLKRKVNQYDINNNFIKQWNSIKEAHRDLNINDANITRCCKGIYKTTGGFIWRYADEEC